tara:strand:+ start:156 stop:359 length:204 start_codon:yes stop_codon:yes gene_type:complete
MGNQIMDIIGSLLVVVFSLGGIGVVLGHFAKREEESIVRFVVGRFFGILLIIAIAYGNYLYWPHMFD